MISRLGKRPTRAVIDIGALRHNYTRLAELLPGTTKVMAVVKADAYGHGDIESARVFEALGCASLGVAIVEEGARLREAGLSSSIVVLGGVWPDQTAGLFDYDLTPVVFDIETARSIDAMARERGSIKNVHVKIDTGMHRLGLPPGDIPGFFAEFKGLSNLRLEALLSHFSEAECEGSAVTDAQLRLFLDSAEAIRGLGVEPGFLEMANSAAAVDRPDARLGLVRPGLMLYGAYPCARYRELIELAPAMRLETRVLCTRDLPEGSAVSYSGTFRTKKKSRMATLAIGYADGLPRSLSNRADVLIRGQRAPIAGNVCMDLTICDVTAIPGAGAGDEAVIIGTQESETITVEEVADKAGTISYEILTGISARVPRVYVDRESRA